MNEYQDQDQDQDQESDLDFSEATEGISEFIGSQGRGGRYLAEEQSEY
jgi:hypothetical protein